MSGAPTYAIKTAMFPREGLLNFFRDYLRVYEAVRIKNELTDLADPGTIDANAQHLANTAGLLFDDTCRAYAKHIVNTSADIGYAAGLGRPKPIIQVV